MTLDQLVESALAAHRITRLVVSDRITRSPRRRWIARAYHQHTYELETLFRASDADAMRAAVDAGKWERVVELDEDPPLAATWATCAWCAGMWVTAAVTVLDATDRPWWRHTRRALALSDAVGLIGGHERSVW